MSGTECNNRVLTFIYSTRQTTLRPRERDCDHRTQSVSHLSSEYILNTNGGALKHKATQICIMISAQSEQKSRTIYSVEGISSLH